MKVIQINTFSNKSTGSIMFNIHEYLKKNNIDSYVVWGRGRKQLNDHEYYMNNRLSVYMHALYTRISGKTGFASKKDTKKLLNWIDKINPDVILLHNLHGYYINIEMLFNYFKTHKNIRIIWTLHDCWAFTGQCPHFEYVNCDKWETCCYNCPQINRYPKTFKDNSTFNYKKKKELFSNLKIDIITPSEWLANLVKKSFLKDNHVEVINNGINTEVFKKVNNDEFRKKYNLENKKILLGVSSDWTDRKGLNDFINLSKLLTNKYKIVLVGLTKKQIKKLPSNILGISNTSNVLELREIYSTADLFLNLTHEDNYPTVNLEAQACATPVVTYDTGGSKETILSGNGCLINFHELVKNIDKYIELECNNNSIKSKESMCEDYYNFIMNKKYK